MDSYWSEENGKLYDRLYKFIINNWNTSNEKPLINNYLKNITF